MRRFDVLLEEKHYPSRNKTITFVDMLKNDSQLKMKKSPWEVPPLVDLDSQEDMEERNEVDDFLKGKNIPLKGIFNKKVVRT
jgi:hypothetical protein